MRKQHFTKVDKLDNFRMIQSLPSGSAVRREVQSSNTYN